MPGTLSSILRPLARQAHHRTPMDSFVNPRSHPTPRASRAPCPTTSDPDQLVELHRHCREGRLYDVENWVRSGRPLQTAPGTPVVPRKRATSALEIALAAGNSALALLLLCNGYDPNREPHSPLDLALRARRFDLVDLLLAWGADPQGADLDDLFNTYRLDLFERFQALGVSLTAGHALASALAYHTSNRPLFGFAKRYRESDPKIQTELNIALAHHVGEGNEKGVQLSVWAGADPHAPAPSLRFPTVSEADASADDGDRFFGFSAVYEACLCGRAAILKRLGPDPARDDFEELYRAARGTEVIEILLRLARPRDVGALIDSHLRHMSLGFSDWGAKYALSRLFELGVRWEGSSAETIAAVRWSLLKLPDHTFVDVVKLLATEGHCEQENLRELARTPSMLRRLKRVGFIHASLGEPGQVPQPRPTRAREVLSKLGVVVPKPAKPLRLPRTVRIGPSRANGGQVRLDRAGLYEAVWSQPVATLAEQWGLSGPGLKKVCRRLQIPVPPRGYWARVKVGQRQRRPALPRLPAGEAEEIIIAI